MGSYEDYLKDPTVAYARYYEGLRQVHGSDWPHLEKSCRGYARGLGLELGEDWRPEHAAEVQAPVAVGDQDMGQGVS